MPPELAQSHAHGGLAHAERLRSAAHTTFVVERDCDGQQIEVELHAYRYSIFE
jgi:hypothetical protein